MMTMLKDSIDALPSAVEHPIIGRINIKVGSRVFDLLFLIQLPRQLYVVLYRIIGLSITFLLASPFLYLASRLCKNLLSAHLNKVRLSSNFEVINSVSDTLSSAKIQSSRASACQGTHHLLIRRRNASVPSLPSTYDRLVLRLNTHVTQTPIPGQYGLCTATDCLDEHCPSIKSIPEAELVTKPSHESEDEDDCTLPPSLRCDQPEHL